MSYYWIIPISIVVMFILFSIAFWVFTSYPSNKQVEKIKEWLIWVCIEAEKKLGDGTGQVKLRYVYDLFVQRFSWVSRIISFDSFSALVDEALISVRAMIANNGNVANYVSEKEES